ncbi:MAG: hypothetical protein IKQ97_02730, partial [Eubacterium sp.]|nr:hypothetical protein [Eubacterium sp.]
SSTNSSNYSSFDEMLAAYQADIAEVEAGDKYGNNIVELASKAIPGFDVMDYGQEDYVFGSSSADARHWDRHMLDVFEEHSDELAELFN